jgi:uncharacterized protein
MEIIMNWRKWFKIVHRDLGYTCVGLTIIYSISGIAVNHINDWNPNYIIENLESEINPPSVELSDTKKAEEILKKLKIEKPVNSTFKSAPDELQIFLEKHTITANLKTGKVHQEIVNNRAILRESNFLHLNNAKKMWTYIADLFAVSLIALAVSGLFLISGKNGLAGRGKWFLALGFSIPIIFLMMYF